MNFFRTPIFYAIVGVAIVLTIGWAIYDNIAAKRAAKNAASTTETTTTETATTTDIPVSNLTNLDPADFDAIVKRESALADQKALEVGSGYLLSTIEVSFGQNLSPDSTSSRYVYSSTADAKNNWMITIAQTSGNYLRALVPKDDYLGDLSAINTKLVKYNYVTALQLAEKAGGMSWRENNKLLSVKLTLRHSGANNWLLWIVQYASSERDFTVQLDANSGKVITE